jgi:hypothetical protein
MAISVQEDSWKSNLQYQTNNHGAAVERFSLFTKELCNRETPIIIARAITHCAR